MLIGLYDLIVCMNILTILFIALKVFGKIDWKWRWVYAPVWVPIALIVVCLMF